MLLVEPAKWFSCKNLIHLGLFFYRVEIFGESLLSTKLGRNFLRLERGLEQILADARLDGLSDLGRLDAPEKILFVLAVTLW